MADERETVEGTKREGTGTEGRGRMRQMRVYIPRRERGDERGEVAFRRASKLAIFPSRRDASSTRRRRRRRSNLFENSKSLGRNDGLGIKCMRQPSVFAPRPRNLSAGSPRARGRRDEATEKERVIRHQKVSTGRSTDFGSRLPRDGLV